MYPGSFVVVLNDDEVAVDYEEPVETEAVSGRPAMG
jgi:hypothetical protein